MRSVACFSSLLSVLFLLPGCGDDKTHTSPSKVGETWTNSIGMKLTYIPSGKFTMGSPRSEEHRDKDESQHEVTISKPFLMATTEVTQKQWVAVMGENPSRFKGDNLPVEKVSWDDVQKFIAKLNAKEGRKYRLPTEAEWEYACRAGTTTPFNTGRTVTTSQANFDGDYTYAGSSKGIDRKKTTPVGSFKANAWGLYDMHGNVWEWCQDWYGAYPKGAVTDPAGPKSGSRRVLRGGSWNDWPRNCRSAFRLRNAPVNRGYAVGFRFVLDP